MEFGTSKCALLVIKRGKFCQSEEGETYKYLGVLEADDIKHEAIKGNIQIDYLRMVRSILNSKLSGGNVMRAINSRAVFITVMEQGLLTGLWRN